MEPALFFEELQVGQQWTSEGRFVSQQDVLQFASLTGDADPLHTDPDFAATTPFGRPIAHGLLGLSMLAGLSSECPRVHTYAFAEIREWHFRRPIFFGDEIFAQAKIANLRPRGRRCGEVVWDRKLLNQLGEVVQEGVLVTLVACQFTASSHARKSANATHQTS